jgi:hypothetical protein
MRTLLLCLFQLLSAAVIQAEEKKTVKVFILAGQSNMEGKAKLPLLEYQVKQPATRPLFAHFEKDGQWVERDDVFIKFLDRKGPLKAGYGSPGCIGPELQFGWSAGDHFREPVLLIKAAWGGRSLRRDFRSPSVGLPPDAALQKMLVETRKKKPEATLDDIKQLFGASWREMMKEVTGVLSDPGAEFPALAGYQPELCGFVWFQGWNDMIDAEATAEYASNLAHFIRDVRRETKSPALPFVVVQMGVDGLKANEGVQRFKAAQAEAAALPEFSGTVKLVKSDAFWDTDAEAVFKKGWREHIDEWNKVGSDWGYHYYGSAKTLCAIGRACAEALNCAAPAPGSK